MGCGDSCPVHPGKRYADWELPDPAGRPIEEVRPIREEIDAKVGALLAELARTGNGLGKTSWLWRSDALTQRDGRRSVPFVCGRFKIRQIPSSSYAEEVERPDDWWVDGMKRLAWFVAEEAGETMGVIAGMPLEDTPEVVSMWMDPEHRGTGVADGLLAAVVAWAEVEDAAGLCLAVAESNQRARRFYERVGFVSTGPGEALRSRPDICTAEMHLDLGGDIR